MPRYDLFCKACGFENEFSLRFDEARPPCPDCDQELAVRISEVPGVMWNVSGSTRSFASKSLPKNATGGHNMGHSPPTLQSLGLTAEDGKELGL